MGMASNQDSFFSMQYVDHRMRACEKRFVRLQITGVSAVSALLVFKP